MKIFTFTTLICYLGSIHGADIREPPSIEEPPPNKIPSKYFKRGASFLLPCKSTKGQPTPIDTWTHNSMTLNLLHHNIKEIPDGILIERADSDRAGTYQCQAKNQYGISLSQLFVVQMAMTGSFPAVKPIDPFYGSVGRHLLIKRRVLESIPDPTYTWKKVGDREDDSPTELVRDRRIVQDREGNLHFTYLKETDTLSAGDDKLYKVDVYNSVIDSTTGGSYSNITLNGGPPAGDSPPNLVYPTINNKLVKVLEGKKMEIQCIFEGFPVVFVTWTGPVPGVQTEGDTVLQLEHMAKNAEGSFTCTGKNRVGQSQHSISVEMETIPKFSDGGRPVGQTLSEEDTAVFVCQTTAETNPPATVEWLINGVPFKGFRARTEVVEIDLGKKLTVTKLQRDKDIKVIQCKVANKHKTLYADAPLNVLLRTVLTSMSPNQTLYVNTTKVVLTCTATTDPSTQDKLTIAWTRDGKPITSYDDPSLKEAEGTLTLSLDDLESNQVASYAGEYVCNASNGYSHDHGCIGLFYYTGRRENGGGDTGVPSHISMVAIVGSVFGGLLIFGLVVLGGFKWFRKKKKRNGNKQSYPLYAEINESEIQEPDIEFKHTKRINPLQQKEDQELQHNIQGDYIAIMSPSTEESEVQTTQVVQEPRLRRGQDIVEAYAIKVFYDVNEYDYATLPQSSDEKDKKTETPEEYNVNKHLKEVGMLKKLETLKESDIDKLFKEELQVLKKLDLGAELRMILSAESVITVHDAELIATKPTNLEKLEVLLTILRKRSHRQKVSFFKCLQETEQGHILTELGLDLDVVEAT